MSVATAILRELRDAVENKRLLAMSDFAESYPGGVAALVASDPASCRLVLAKIRNGMSVAYGGTDHPRYPGNWHPVAQSGLLRELSKAADVGNFKLVRDSFAERNAAEAFALAATDLDRTGIVNALRRRQPVDYSGECHPRNPASSWYREHGPKDSWGAAAKALFASKFGDPKITRRLIAAPNGLGQTESDKQWFAARPGRSVKIRVLPTPVMGARAAVVIQVEEGFRLSAALTGQGPDPELETAEPDEALATTLVSRWSGYDEIIAKYFSLS
jgi:hypothetical protein